MLVEKRIWSGGGIIAIWKVTENIPELLDSLSQKEFYLPFFRILTTEKRQKEWLAARLLVEIFCGKDKTVSYNDQGKPYLTDHSYHISISHTKNYVCLIAHPTKEVGIDIEHIHNKICRLKERFLHKEELKHIHATNEVIHLLLHWGAKEVLFKMMNEQNVDFSEQLRIDFFIPQISGTFSGRELKTKEQKEYVFEYCIEPEFTLVWSVREV